MLNLKKGQEILNADEDKCIVDAVIDGAYMIDGKWYTDKSIQGHFILPKEKWVPKEGDAYYFFDTDLSIRTYISDSTFEDMAGIKVGNCFQTESEAQKVVEEIKKLLNK